MAPNENQIIHLILLCSGNITLFHCSPLEGMLPRPGSSLFLLMSSSLDFPICKNPECTAPLLRQAVWKTPKLQTTEKATACIRETGWDALVTARWWRWFTCEHRISPGGGGGARRRKSRRGGQNKGWIHANPLIIIALGRGWCHFAMSNGLPHALGVYLQGASLLFEL